MRFKVYVRLKAGVLDVQGKAIEGGLKSLGFNNVDDVRIGKLVELSITADSEDEAKNQADEICQKLLANPVIEDYEIKVV